ncbi:hypothetical protein TNCV_4708241 [Trichonephila clavipes]|nr:hypothetical protein TNCV_4708241 [Trichonephila clavipes]
MAQTYAESVAEQHAARLEDAHLRAYHSCFATSNLLCSQQRNAIGCEWLKYANQKQHASVKHDFVPSGQGIGSWQACHDFEPSTTKDPPCREAMHVKSVKSSNVLPLMWCGSWEREVPFQVSSSSLDHGSKRRGPSPKALA